MHSDLTIMLIMLIMLITIMLILIKLSFRPFPVLEKHAIRVLVFKDCDRKGKSLLFDSKSFVKNEVQRSLFC